MALLSRGDVDGAARLMLQEGAMPEICGRVCPSERFCERVCSMQEAEGAVMIPDIERAVSQYVLDHGFKPGIRRARVPAKAAVIGAGPAGSGLRRLSGQTRHERDGLRQRKGDWRASVLRHSAV